MGDKHPAAKAGREHTAVRAVIAALSARAEAIRRAELAGAERRLRGLTTTERDIVDTVTKRLVCALLHEPTARLNAAGPEGADYVGAIRHLFGLDRGEAAAPKDG
jgi:glutamyl-tRNA reductase